MNFSSVLLEIPEDVATKYRNDRVTEEEPEAGETGWPGSHCIVHGNINCLLAPCSFHLNVSLQKSPNCNRSTFIYLFILTVFVKKQKPNHCAVLFEREWHDMLTAEVRSSVLRGPWDGLGKGMSQQSRQSSHNMESAPWLQASNCSAWRQSFIIPIPTVLFRLKRTIFPYSYGMYVISITKEIDGLLRGPPFQKVFKKCLRHPSQCI